MQVPPDAPASPTVAESGTSLIAFVAARDVPCPACGYNLRALRASACPECGERLELRVGLAEPRMGLWIAGLVGLAAGAGFNGLLLAYCASVSVVIPQRVGFPARFVLFHVFALLAEGAMLAAWLGLRPRLRRLGTTGRSALVAAAWVAAFANVALFIRVLF